jgi:hypothetical protein
MDPLSTSIARSTTRIPAMTDSDNRDAVPSADEQARRQREIGDGTAVYGEVGESDEQADINQPEPDEHF